MNKNAYREIAVYILWGAVTTFVNVAVYSLCRINQFLSIQISTILAWFVSVFTAFVSNKYFVFQSKKQGRGWIRELYLFYFSRILSGIIDITLMTIATQFALLPEKAVKLLVNIFIIIINYAFSKIIVFRRKHETR
jgi:putative flippase GtrA